MKRKTRIFVSLTAVLCMLLGSIVCQKPQEALADSDAIQVNGKYTLTNKKLITKCKLETADGTLKKKTRIYTLTSKTKIQKVKSDFSKKTIKGKKRKQMIKKLNKKNPPIQFKVKKGKITMIWII